MGKLILASTGHGICFVGLGDSTEELLSALTKEYPQATLSRARERDLERPLRHIKEYLDGGRTDLLELQLDVRGTAFQWRVWKKLQSIPSGETRSYSQIAEELSNPDGARAVARACATNPVALLIPCHRVVGKNGELAGYRWGIERKEALLEAELGGPRSEQ